MFNVDLNIYNPHNNILMRKRNYYISTPTFRQVPLFLKLSRKHWEIGCIQWS